MISLILIITGVVFAFGTWALLHNVSHAPLALEDESGFSFVKIREAKLERPALIGAEDLHVAAQVASWRHPAA